MIKAPKMVGYNFLHTHTVMEKRLGVDSEHVIVDREDWEHVARFFNQNPDLSRKLNKFIENNEIFKF